MAHTDDTTKLTVDNMPKDLHRAFKSKAAQEGVSMRALIVGWIGQYLRGELPPPPAENQEG